MIIAETGDFFAGAGVALAGVLMMMIFFIVGEWMERRR